MVTKIPGTISQEFPRVWERTPVKLSAIKGLIPESDISGSSMESNRN